MKRIAILAVSIMLLLSGCGSGNDQPDSPAQTDPVAPQDVEEQKNTETYDDIAALFADVCTGDITIRNQSGSLAVRILSTEMTADAAPDDWEDILGKLSNALDTSKQQAADTYGLKNVTAQLELEDGTILASGYNGSVKFDFFEAPDPVQASNPRTVSKSEFNQISVGMTLSQVEEIIGGSGTLDSEYGSAGSTLGSTRTYTWIGEGREGAYASILFDDFEVYSKHEFGLE